MGAPATPAAPAKPGSTKESIFKDLEKRVKPDSQTSAKADQPSKPAKEPDEQGKAAKPAAPVEVSEEEEPPAGDSPVGDKAVPATDPKKGKVSPWKLVEEYKAKLAAAEAKVLETEKRAIPEDKWKATTETLTAKEKRLAELEEEIKFVNYQKSEPYKKMQAEYEGAWSRAVSSLSEIQVETDGGNSRPMNAEDILELVNATDVKAKKLAIEKYGDMEGLVMQHRDKIRQLFEHQASEEQKARSEGSEREKAHTEKQQREFGELAGVVKETWSKANSDITADPKYGKFFTPVDGDEQGNQRLAKGFELADRAFSENPTAPGLTKEQRQEIVKRHAAVRNRAAAFGKLVYMNQQKDAQIAELKKLVDEYKGSEPDTSGSKPNGGNGEKRTTMSTVMDDLRKRAKQ
jgi:hypothetical protein